MGLDLGKPQAEILTISKGVKQFLSPDHDLSPNTRKAFSADLRRFVAQYGDRRVSGVSAVDIREYLSGLTTPAGEPVAPATYNRHFGTLQNFFNWLDRLLAFGGPRLDARLITYRVNPMKSLKRKRTPSRLPRPLSKDQVRTILGRIDAPRDKALFTLLYDSGLRIQEALNLRIDDMDLGQGTVRVLGKGDRERPGFLSQRVVHLIKRYLRERGNPSNGFIFVSRQHSESGGSRLSYAMAHKLFRDYSDGLIRGGKTATIHQLRHAFGSERAGVIDCLALKQLMGHQSLRTTLQYAEVNPAAARAAFRRYESLRETQDGL
jgi:integrase/recombinase XerD